MRLRRRAVKGPGYAMQSEAACALRARMDFQSS